MFLKKFRWIALAAITDLTLFLVFPDRLYHGTVALTLAKLYSNSLLVVFNNRIHLSIDMRNSESSTAIGSNIVFVAPTAFRHSTVTSSFNEFEYQLQTDKPANEEGIKNS